MGSPIILQIALVLVAIVFFSKLIIPILLLAVVYLAYKILTNKSLNNPEYMGYNQPYQDNYNSNPNYQNQDYRNQELMAEEDYNDLKFSTSYDNQQQNHTQNPIQNFTQNQPNNTNDLSNRETTFDRQNRMNRMNRPFGERFACNDKPVNGEAIIGDKKDLVSDEENELTPVAWSDISINKVRGKDIRFYINEEGNIEILTDSNISQTAQTELSLNIAGKEYRFTCIGPSVVTLRNHSDKKVTYSVRPIQASWG